jgi:hypothetical protein
MVDFVPKGFRNANVFATPGCRLVGGEHSGVDSLHHLVGQWGVRLSKTPMVAGRYPLSLRGRAQPAILCAVILKLDGLRRLDFAMCSIPCAVISYKHICTLAHSIIGNESANVSKWQFVKVLDGGNM